MVMRAFTDTVATKAQLIANLERHAQLDAIVSGTYWEDGKGCAVGCSIHDFAPGEEDQHAQYERLFGIPQAIARLEDRIFEGLPSEDQQAWPLRFARAVPEGADLSHVVPAVLVRTMERRLAALDALDITAALRQQVGDAIRQVIAVLVEWRDTGVVNESAASAARSAASAAWSAESAARSAESAAASAAWSARSAEWSAWSAASAARSAASAAWSARSAAWSAAWSAESAARSAESAESAASAEYQWLADTLIEEMEKCAPVEAAA